MKLKHSGFYILISVFIMLAVLKLTGWIELKWAYITIPIDIIFICLVLFIFIVVREITKHDKKFKN